MSQSNNRAYNRTLEAWAKEWREEHLTEEEREMIRDANFDLYHGPIGDGAIGDPCEAGEFPNYPGFTTACSMIAAVLQRDLPRCIWIDVGAEYASEIRPDEDEPCPHCAGTGESQETIAVGEDVSTCEECNGSARVPAFLEDWYEVEARELRIAIVGQELEGYVR